MAADQSLMEARLTNGEIFQKIVDGARHIVHELNFVCTDQGLRANSLDDTNTIYIDVNLSCDGFEEYFCAEGEHKMGLNLEFFQRAMKIGFAKDSLFLRFMREDENLHVEWTSPSDERESQFQVRLMDQSVLEDYPPPQHDTSFEVEMNSSVLAKIINSYASLASEVEFTVDSKSLQLAILGVDLLDGIVKHRIGDREGHELRISRTGRTRSITQKFQLSHWFKFMKSAPLARMVKLHFTKDDGPCVIEYSLGDLGEIRFFTSPTVNLED